ncbi:alanine-glyoxylate transaminase/serine-glyoxylate transaminase/serine-pyruvate transaminase [Halalkaliarchaeum desulfuricum]|uniref:Alanine-glyoxylate transaminase/serine-glyoxylate transaminase/serine-pyruvate transaminase n=1 Tax=Halalkaliarchaeum desulfuricum TaxID=2055893 RepID=A0A343TJW4_9EURY|nr:alanine--glyoxylate aminotransferase family protein [Halalkaliarchaeum desulfuricum]AUX09386.1 alanine-glyoxylate transaminase/serine-glyoxylate transaminase/serine-pyruvate transaminase [Halalkaliarchaeum desulfuricum]
MARNSETDELVPPDRTLLGPGPSDAHPRVLKAMATPFVGYLDDYYVEVMDDVQELLRMLFCTDNEYTFAVSGTGSAAMETAFANLVEPGETVLVPSNGYFGDRMGQIAERAGGEVVTVDAPWGEPLDPDDVAAAFDRHEPTVFGFVHGETSTGARQTQIPELARIAHDHDAYVIADTVASLGGVEFRTDEWGVDVVYSGSQKCLSAPPGSSPITFNDRAVQKVHDREEPVRSWYLDLEGVWEYWGAERNYHHTGPTATTYALREALRMVEEEGLEDRWARHRRVAGALKAGVEAMGVPLNVDDDHWLPTLNPVQVPDGVDDGRVIDRLMDEHGIEIVGGLGALSGDIFRVGCMGNSARPENITHFIAAFGSILAEEGADVDSDAGAVAAARALEE